MQSFPYTYFYLVEQILLQQNLQKSLVLMLMAFRLVLLQGKKLENMLTKKTFLKIKKCLTLR